MKREANPIILENPTTIPKQEIIVRKRPLKDKQIKQQVYQMMQTPPRHPNEVILPQKYLADMQPKPKEEVKEEVKEEIKEEIKKEEETFIPVFDNIPNLDDILDNLAL
jgi:hypothetical protein